jgi:uncharacterized protein (DUF3084 family)
LRNEEYVGSVVFAFLLIMIAGGFIAYFGDRLGYVMGKKRLTLFGLRPRHTATALTVIAGVVIGGVALTFLLAVNQSFRIALLNGTREFRLNLRLRHSNARLAALANANQLAAISAQKSAAAALLQTQIARTGLSNAQQTLVLEQKKTLKVQAQLALKQVDLARLTVALSDEHRDLAAVKGEIELADSDRQRALNIAFQYLVHRRSGSLIYRNLGEVGRTVIPASELQGQIRLDLVRFLNRLSVSATSKGAATGANGRSVVVASIKIPDPVNLATNGFVGENGSLDALAASIHSFGSGSVVVVASALGNSFDNNQVIIVLRPYANVIAIRAGTQIAQIIISSSSGTVDDIASQFQRFLVTDVRPAAKEAGVIPVRNPQTGAEELGDVTLDQIYQIVNQVREVNGPALITASAANDIYSADQLKLVFFVKAASPSDH